MRFQHLGAAPRLLVDGLSTKLLSTLAPINNEARIIAFLRLFFVACGRLVGVGGCSLRAIAMRSSDELIEATARVLSVLAPDQARIVGVYESALAEIRANPAWGDGNRDVADPDLSPLRGQPSASPARASSQGLQDDVAQEALRLLGEQARRAKPWRTSHELTADDGFSSSQLALLRRLPAYGWTSDDENKDVLLRSVRSIAKHMEKNAALPIDAIVSDLRQQLKVSRRTLAPTWLSGLHLAIHTHDDTAARIALAELALTAEADADELLFPRVVLARQMPRTDKAESVAVLAAKSTLPSAVGELPLRLREKISKLA